MTKQNRVRGVKKIRKNICKNCGKETIESFEGLCHQCYYIGDLPEILNFPIPEELLFVASIAKFGKRRRIIEIPKNQRKLIKLGIDYYVQLRPVEEME